MTPPELPRDIGGFIRDLRRNAKISLRQLADQAGVSNPYLSQIERGLRKPSAEVLQQLASALRVSTPAMYLRAGLLDGKEGPGVVEAIATDPDLTMAQKQSLNQIYDTFRRENARASHENGTIANETVTPGPAMTGPAVAEPVVTEVVVTEIAATEPALPKPALPKPAVPEPALPDPAGTDSALTAIEPDPSVPAKRTRRPAKKTTSTVTTAEEETI